MRKRILLVVILTFLNIGCATSGFTEFYEVHQAIQTSHITCNSPIVKNISNFDDVQFDMYAQGFDLIGYANFNGREEQANDEVFAQGKKIGACLAVWNAEYQRTEEVTLAMPSYTSGTTSTATHYGTVGSGGAYGSYQGSSTTYTPGTMSTNYVPLSFARYNYESAFFVKIINNPYSLMIMVTEPPISYMKRTDSRNGVLVKAAMIGGLAHKANIFQDDIIVSINGENVNLASDPRNLLKKGAGNELVIYRDGENITKQIALPPAL